MRSSARKRFYVSCVVKVFFFLFKKVETFNHFTQCFQFNLDEEEISVHLNSPKENRLLDNKSSFLLMQEKEMLCILLSETLEPFGKRVATFDRYKIVPHTALWLTKSTICNIFLVYLNVK